VYHQHLRATIRISIYSSSTREVTEDWKEKRDGESANRKDPCDFSMSFDFPETEFWAWFLRDIYLLRGGCCHLRQSQ
jgi:hypothetical protein